MIAGAPAFISDKSTINVDAIPDEIKHLPQFGLWRYEDREGKPTKIPYSSPGHRLKVNSPKSWRTFADALRAKATWDQHRDKGEKYCFEGVCFLFTEIDPYCGIDLDDCIDPGTGEFLPWAKPIIESMASYAEVSPSRTGVKMWIKGLKPGKRCRTGVDAAGLPWKKGNPNPKAGDIEIYESRRLFTVTGNKLEGMPSTIEDRQAELIDLFERLFPPNERPEPLRKKTTTPTILSDDVILKKAMAAKNGDKFTALWAGSSDGYASDSEADLAFCNQLAFWCQGDANHIDTLFRQSGRMREKWDRDDYRGETIEKAIEICNGVFYDPKHKLRDEATGEIKPNEADDDPHRLARMFLEPYRIDDDDSFLIARYRDQTFQWLDGAYRLLPEMELKADVIRSVKDEFDRINLLEIAAYDPAQDEKNEGPPVCRKVTNPLIGNVTSAMSSETIVPGDSEPPIWRGSEPFPFDLRKSIIARNLIVSLPDLVAGKPLEEYSIPSTPKMFSLSCLGCDFDPNPPEPKNFFAFLNSVWPQDAGAIQTLQEWMGLCTTADTSFQKIMMLIGPPRSGKGTIARLLTAIIDKRNIGGPTLASLTTNFGLSQLLHKSVGIISDARLPKKADTAAITERLLSISGEDTLTVDRKHISHVDHRFTARLMILSNEVPQIIDASGAFASRLIVVTMNESWLGKEDTQLESKLMKELPGILKWAIDGWARLQSRGYFVQPESSAETIEEIDTISSPVRAFIRDCCVLNHTYTISRDELYDEWKAYCLREGIKNHGEKSVFGSNLKKVLGRKISEGPRLKLSSGARVRTHAGIGIAGVDLTDDIPTEQPVMSEWGASNDY